MERGPDEGSEGDLFPIREEDVEAIARREHNEWLEMMEDMGYHPPSHCTRYGRGCSKCNPFVLPYDSLPEAVKKRQLGRMLNMGRMLEEMGYRVVPMSPFENSGERSLAMREGLTVMGPEPVAVRPRTSTYRHP